METVGCRTYLILIKEHARCAGILAKDDRNFFERANGSEGHIFQVAYWGSYYIEGGHSLLVKYTIKVNIITKTSIVYVTRDIERALAIDPQGHYFIISNKTPYSEEVQKRFPDNVWLIEDSRGVIDTYDLLMREDIGQMIDQKKPRLLVFQNTARIERLAAERAWNLLNPSADLAKKVEEKISQIEFLGDDALLLPPHKVVAVKNATFEGTPFILQFNHSHTGEGTHLIDSAAKLHALQEKFPERLCRIVKLIKGPIFTLNVCAGPWVTSSAMSYQITGLSPFTDLPFSTIGNDWALPRKLLSSRDVRTIRRIARKTGKRLKRAGWKGLFGIDVIQDEETGAIYLLEINARQAASVAFESDLQRKAGIKTTIFDAHLATLMGQGHMTYRIRRITDGAQIVKRKTTETFKSNLEALNAHKDLTIITYPDGDYNKELYRIQSEKGIMEAHGKLNALGQSIASSFK